MQRIFQNARLTIVDYVCRATAADTPFEEVHDSYSLSFVRCGSFGCRARGHHHELTAGGFFVGAPGDEFACNHSHYHGADECLSFQFSEAGADEIGRDRAVWSRVFAPPNTALTPLGALAQAALDKTATISVEEAGMLLAARFVDQMRGKNRVRIACAPRETRRAVEAAAWIAAHSAQEIQLGDVASWAELSEFHFLRVFSRTIGVTPHQYLLACRLRDGAERLAQSDSTVTDVAFEVGFDDLSHFHRMFKRATGVTPGQFSRLASGDRKILQAALAQPGLS